MREYYEAWKHFNSPMFDFKISTFGVRRTEYCYAGDWVLDVDIETGKATQCYCSRFSQNIFENLEKPIVFLPIGKHCSLSHCYNSHALMTLGVIPEYQSITYAEVRNRKCVDGSEWFSEEVKQFFSGKFSDNNRTYGSFEKSWIDVRIAFIRGKKLLRRIADRIRS